MSTSTGAAPGTVTPTALTPGTVTASTVTASTVTPTALLSAEMVRLVRASHGMRVQLHSADPDPIEWASAMLLFHLCKDGPQRSSALAAAVCVDPSTVSRQIVALVDAGLVERRADPHDGRATLLAATEAGEARYQRVHARRDRALAVLLADWREDDVQALADLLHRLNDTLIERRGALAEAISQPVVAGDQNDVLENA